MFDDDIAKQAPAAAAEIADRILRGIEAAAGKAGTEFSRVWPELVAARQAESIYLTVLAGLVLSAALVVLIAVWWKVPAWERAASKVVAPNPDMGGLPTAAATALTIAFLVACFGVAPSRGDVAALFAPEGQYIRELVAQAIEKR